MNCGCDNRRDIMFTQGNGHIPVAVLALVAVVVIGYTTIK